jgi:hypothetical protein
MNNKEDDYQVPIEDARNLGPSTGKELRELGIDSLGKLREIGWVEACMQMVSENPNRINLNLFTAIIGAIHEQDWRAIDPELKQQAKELLKTIKNS